MTAQPTRPTAIACGLSFIATRHYPCDPRNPWSTATAMMDPGFHRFHGWTGGWTSAARHSEANHSVEANRRPAAPLGVGSQFGSPCSAPPYLPAAVAHLLRSPRNLLDRFATPDSVAP